MRPWKFLGLAAFAGVTATGVVVVRAERRRRAYTPDEVRDRLHARFAETAHDPASAPAADRPAGTSAPAADRTVGTDA
jgi:hypothetical protein